MRMLVLCAFLSGCALTSKSDVLAVRWFTPETVKPRLTSATEPDLASAPRLELGRVTSGPNLRERIAYRDDAREVGWYDDRRWTERPETYVRRQLARTLFEEHGFVRTLAGQAPILDVEVIAFEEVKKPRAGRIQLRIVIHDDERALFERTVAVERPAAAPGFEAFVQAMSQALDEACEEVAREAARFSGRSP
jgi:cholesterol transport system auxiliary component